MIIMQTLDAAARRRSIEARGVGKVIYSHEHDDAVCIQYHPKGIPGTNLLFDSTAYSLSRSYGVSDNIFAFKAA